VAVFGIVPGYADAAVKQFDELNSSSYCLTVDNGPTAVDFTVKAPGGGALQTLHVTTSTAGQNCAGTVTAGVTSFTASLTSQPGATVVADAGGGVVAAFTMPYSAYDETGSTGIVRIGGLPSASNTLTIGGGGPIVSVGATYVTPAPIAIPTEAVTVASTVSGVSYLAHFSTTRFYIDAPYYGNVTTHGVDPLGAPISISVASGGTQVQATSASPSVDEDQTSTTDTPRRLPSGGTVTVTQPGWFSHAVTMPSLTVRTNGFDAAVPNVAGETGSVSPNLLFQATSGLPTSTPLGCLSFGDATYMNTECGVATARSSATFPAIVTSRDYIEVYANEPDGDQSNYEGYPSGFEAYLDYGAIDGSGLVGSQPITLTGTTPAGVTVSKSQVTYDDGYVGFSDDDGPNTYLPMRIVSGTSFTASGGAVGGTPYTFTANLEASISGTTVTGTTYPNAHLSIQNQRPTGSSPTVYGTANAAGAFSVDVGAVIGRDEIRIYSDDPPTGTISSRTLFANQARPAITGVVDQQLVHGTIALGATSGGPSGILWGGDVPGALATTAPFGYSLNTLLLPDGPFRITADNAGVYDSLGDYLYVRIDNTAPKVDAGPDQTIAVGHAAILLAAAQDANGIASLKVSFGDGTSLVEPAATLGLPLSHVYAKAGQFTATITATDAAGNVTTDSTVIHTTTTLAAQVSGKVQAKLKHHHALKVKFTSHMAGQLAVRVFDAKAKLKGAKLVTFKQASQKATVSLATKKWKKGRYTFVLQFTDANGVAGPVTLQQLRIT
jgi:hypothetical protein